MFDRPDGACRIVTSYVGRGFCVSAPQTVQSSPMSRPMPKTLPSPERTGPAPKLRGRSVPARSSAGSPLSLRTRSRQVVVTWLLLPAQLLVLLLPLLHLLWHQRRTRTRIPRLQLRQSCHCFHLLQPRCHRCKPWPSWRLLLRPWFLLLLIARRALWPRSQASDYMPRLRFITLAARGWPVSRCRRCLRQACWRSCLSPGRLSFVPARGC